MTGNPRSGDAWLCDLAGRLAFTHRLSPDLFSAAAGLPSVEATGMTGGMPVALTCHQRERLELAVNIVLRLEWRLHADTTAMTAWLASPNTALAGRTPAEMMTGGTDALRAVRRAVTTAAVSKERWWRVGHNV